MSLRYVLGTRRWISPRPGPTLLSNRDVRRDNPTSWRWALEPGPLPLEGRKVIPCAVRPLTEPDGCHGKKPAPAILVLLNTPLLERVYRIATGHPDTSENGRAIHLLPPHPPRPDRPIRVNNLLRRQWHRRARPGRVPRLQGLLQ